MNDFLPFIVVGITAGSLYGLAAMGLTLTYKTSGVFNFAHGAVAAAAAYCFSELHSTRGVPWPVALVVSVLIVALFGGYLIEPMARRLSTARTVHSIAGFVGLLLLIQGLLTWRFGFTTQPFPDFISGTGVTVGDLDVSRQQIFAVVVAAAGAVSLNLLFRRMIIGASMRAVVADAELLDLTGTDPVRVRRLAWMLGSGFAGLAGILIAPSLGLDAGLLTLLVVQAFGAAAIGRFSSLTAAYLGGIGLGVAANMLTKVLASTPSLNALPTTLPFITLFIVLIVYPPKVQRLGVPRRSPARPARMSPTARRRAVVVGVLAIAAAPVYAGAKLPVFTNAVVLVPVFVALALLVWGSGQVSLCHAAFAGIGAAVMGHLSHGAGLPFLLALLLASLSVVPIGAIVAIPAIRLSGTYLALATFGFGILVEQIGYGQDFLFGALGTQTASRPSLALTDARFHVLAVAIAFVVVVFVAVLARSRFGRLLRALGDAPVALSTGGVAVNTTKVLAFCVSSFLAGVTGAMSVVAVGSASGRGYTFGSSLVWLTVLVVCGTNILGSGVVAAFVLALVPAYGLQELVPHLPLLFGVVAVLAALSYDGGINLPKPRSARGRRSPIRQRFVDRPARPVEAR